MYQFVPQDCQLFKSPLCLSIFYSEMYTGWKFPCFHQAVRIISGFYSLEQLFLRCHSQKVSHFFIIPLLRHLAHWSATKRWSMTTDLQTTDWSITATRACAVGLPNSPVLLAAQLLVLINTLRRNKKHVCNECAVDREKERVSEQQNSPVPHLLSPGAIVLVWVSVNHLWAVPSATKLASIGLRGCVRSQFSFQSCSGCKASLSWPPLPTIAPSVIWGHSLGQTWAKYGPWARSSWSTEN